MQLLSLIPGVAIQTDDELNLTTSLAQIISLLTAIAMTRTLSAWMAATILTSGSNSSRGGQQRGHRLHSRGRVKVVELFCGYGATPAPPSRRDSQRR